MLMVFQRHVTHGKTPEDKDTVQAQVVVSHEGKVTTIGVLHFPDKTTWAKFFGAIQKGALDIRDLDVKMEDSPEPFKKEGIASAHTK